MPANVTSAVLRGPTDVLGEAVGDEMGHYCTQVGTRWGTSCVHFALGLYSSGDSGESRKRPRAPLAGRGARVPAVQHEGGLAIRGNQGGVAGQYELARVLVPPGDIDGLACVHV